VSKSNSLENQMLLHLFNNAAITLVGDAAGVLPSAVAGSLYVSLHTADPDEAGDQTTNEIAYTGYARVAVARSGAGWTVDTDHVHPAANIDFPISAGGAGGTVTHFGVGCVDLATGAGKLLYSGTVTPNIVVSSGVTPRLTTASSITEG
jgi:hypothetical protein